MILFAKPIMKFEEETNSFVQHNEDFVKSGVRQTEVLYENFHRQK